MIVWIVLVVNISCANKTLPEPPVNLIYKIVHSKIYVSWEQSPNNTEDIAYLINYGDERWNYTGTNEFYDYFFDRRVGTHSIQVKAVDRAGNESVPAQLQFEYSE